MKTLFFCNLIPNKTGAFETLLAAIGQEFNKADDEFVVVFAGEPIQPVAESLRAAGVRWCLMPEWVGGEEKVKGYELSVISNTNNEQRITDNPANNQQPTTNNHFASCEIVHPWSFVLPALRLLRQERPDVAVVHFGNELPTMLTILLCRLVGWCSRLLAFLTRHNRDQYQKFEQKPLSPRRRVFFNRLRRQCNTPLRSFQLLFKFPSDPNSCHNSTNSTLKELTTRQLNNSTTFLPPRWVWQQDQQIQDPGRVGKHLSRLRLLSIVADQFVAVYEGGRQSMLKRGIPSAKITVIHNSVAPYMPTRPKGWLRGEFCGRENEEKSISHEVAKGAKRERNSNIDRQDEQNTELGNSIPEPSCKSCTSLLTPSPCFFYTSHLTSHVSPSAEVILVTNGSLIPRKRIDFILQVCAQLKDSTDVGTTMWGGCPHPPCSPSVTKADEDIRPTTKCEAPPALRSDVYDPCVAKTMQGGLMSMVSLPPWRLLIIGDGPEKQRLLAMAEELEIAARVHFLGLRNDVREIMPECDIYLHAASAEACSYAILESMSAGIPAIVLNAGAAREQIEDGNSGYVLEYGDPLLYAARVRALIDNPSVRVAMGARANLRWQEKWTTTRAAVQFHKLYKKECVN